MVISELAIRNDSRYALMMLCTIRGFPSQRTGENRQVDYGEAFLTQRKP